MPLLRLIECSVPSLVASRPLMRCCFRAWFDIPRNCCSTLANSLFVSDRYVAVVSPVCSRNFLILLMFPLLTASSLFKRSVSCLVDAPNRCHRLFEMFSITRNRVVTRDDSRFSAIVAANLPEVGDFWGLSQDSHVVALLIPDLVASALTPTTRYSYGS